MTYSLEIRPDALADIQKAASWYDDQQPGLRAEFLRQVIEATDTLLQNPLSYRLRHKRKSVRWKLLDRFPYRIVFRKTDNLITVIAVLHTARHDRQWRQRP